ncbi:hypothetical protein Fmac_016707 [Flemingia macrophylla]|uniref:Reverse transcriptase zinc-binding domain-containing protein n=1 Tax=Flemingia macrophylla TaxID=520843 RepID=A0ABD1MIB0_9FABA
MVQVQQHQQDKWMWQPNKAESYSVKSTYSLISSSDSVDHDFPNSNLKIMCTTQDSSIHLEGSPGSASYKRQLFRRNIALTPQHQFCPFYRESIERVSHVLLSCNLVDPIWKSWLSWFDSPADQHLWAKTSMFILPLFRQL